MSHMGTRHQLTSELLEFVKIVTQFATRLFQQNQIWMYTAFRTRLFVTRWQKVIKLSSAGLLIFPTMWTCKWLRITSTRSSNASVKWRLTIKLKKSEIKLNWSQMFQKDFIRKTVFRSFISKQTPKKVHKILLTGGPCGGKTTMLAKL